MFLYSVSYQPLLTMFHDLASCRSLRNKPLASLKNAPRILSVRRFVLALVRRKPAVLREQFFLRNLPVRVFDSWAQGFSTPLPRYRSYYPPPLPNPVRTYQIKHYQALRDSSLCLSRANTSRKAPNWISEEEHTWGTPSSTNHTAAASQLTGRIAKTAKWLHLSRVSTSLHPP